MRRFAILCTILAVTATGAWALPAGQADPTVGPAPAEPDANAPALRLADVSGTAARHAAPMPTTSRDDVHVEGRAKHLSVEEPETAPEPIAVVTTTTPPPPTAVAPAPNLTVAFSASQAYGSCGEDVPYDIFSGTATPGSAVTISSPYGSGSATSDGSGHWEKTVEFPSAPRNERFTVSVSGLGGSESFTFMATGTAH